jgi:predicted ATPase
MLNSLQLKNFKGFQDQRVEFRRFSVVIGRNNAGKSSAFEAIRILSNVISKFASGKFSNRPSWIDGDGVGISPPIDDQQRKPETLFFRYEDPPATIQAEFSNGTKVEVFIGTGGILFAEATTPKNRVVDSRSKARECEFPPVAILPQIRPLEDYERVLRAEYVRKCIDTHLSSRHFRNQIRFLKEHFDSFRDLFQQTWQGIRVSEFIAHDAQYEDELSLMLMDDGFVAEAANFGHGLQMWLQIIWFLARTPSESVVVLDEPDVYMHPEQQARMVSLLRDRFRQCLVSTHSEQIINECDESDLLRLHRNIPVSKHGLTQSTYDQYVDNPVRKLPRQINKKVGASILKVVLYGESKVSIWDGNGEPVASIKCNVEGETHKLTLSPDLYKVSLLSPQDVELYVDGKCHSSLGSSGQSWAEFDLDLTK